MIKLELPQLDIRNLPEDKKAEAVNERINRIVTLLEIMLDSIEEGESVSDDSVKSLPIPKKISDLINDTGFITGVDWGDIEGSVEDQTDLLDALEAKQDVLTAGTDIRITEGTAVTLPQGYTPVEYIQSNGSQYIDTGVNAQTGTSAITTLEYVNLPTDNSMLSARRTDRMYLIHSYPANHWCYGYGSYYPMNTLVMTTGVKYTLTSKLLSGEQSISSDGVAVGAVGTSTTEYNLGLNYYLFAMNNGGTASAGSSARVYDCQMFLNGVLKRHFVPCIQDSNNEAGLFDLVSQTFFRNLGTGAFTAGEVLSTNTIIEFTNDTGYITGADIVGKADDSDVVHLAGAETVTGDKTFTKLIKGTSALAQAIPYGEVDSTSTHTAYTATVDGITELKDGTAMLLKNGVVTSASGFTININGLGAKPVYSNMATGNDITPTAPTRDTTIFNINYTMFFIYSETLVTGGAWICYRGYDANTNTIGYQLRTNSMSLPMSDIVYRYRLLFTSADGTKFVPANTSSSTNATSARTVNQRPIDPFGSIVYYGATASVASGSRPGATVLWRQYAVTLGYSFNRTGSALTLTSWKPVYVKCEPQNDGSAIIDPDSPFVQALPTTEDGKIYIFLGVATSATAIELEAHHPVYCYKDGAIRLWTNGEDVADAYVIKQGSYGSKWEYRIWSNGFQEVWYSGSVTFSSASASAGGWNRSTENVTIPISSMPGLTSFADDAVVIVSGSYSGRVFTTGGIKTNGTQFEAQMLGGTSQSASTISGWNVYISGYQRTQ